MRQLFPVSIIVLGLIISFNATSQAKPEILMENRISTAYFIETRVDSNGIYQYKDALNATVHYNEFGKDVLFELFWYQENKVTVRRRYFKYDDDQNEIESFEVTLESDSSLSDTTRHYRSEFSNQKIIRKYYYPIGKVTTFPRTITSYHYVREGYYFTYSARSTNSQKKRTGVFDLERKEFRSSEGMDTTITIQYEVRPRENSGMGVYDSIILKNPDTLIHRVDNINRSRLISDLKVAYPILIKEYSTFDVFTRYSNGKSRISKVLFYNSTDQVVMEVKFDRNEDVYKVSNVSYNSKKLYVASETIYYPSLTKWSRRVEYEIF